MKTPFPLFTICGIEELEAHRGRAVTHVLSIVDPDFPDLDVFTRFEAHQRTVLRFHDAIEPEPDIVLPRREDVAAILEFGRAIEAEDGADGHLLVHCHMGISRSTAAMLMLLAQAHPEAGEAELATRIRAIRPVAWPNLVMVTFADDILGRGGRLVAAAARLYAGNLAEKPWLVEAMAKLNRRRELDMGRAAEPLAAV